MYKASTDAKPVDCTMGWSIRVSFGLVLLLAQLIIDSYAVNTQDDAQTPEGDLKDPVASQTEEKYLTQYVVDRNTLILRRRILLYKDDLYTEWSDWGNCSVKDCTEFRFRKCKDESYEDRITDLFRTKSCPFLYIAETRECRDTSLCKVDGPSDILRNLSDTCGVRNVDGAVETKILGGKTAVPHSWPWQVGLYAGTRTAGLRAHYSRRRYIEAPFCGGTLIAPGWIVTAAHCLTELIPHKELPIGQPFSIEDAADITVRARLGDHSRAEVERSQRDHVVQTAIIHPDYRRGFSEDGFDVALLKLAEDAEFQDTVSAICVPDKNLTLPEGLTCYAAGWGDMSADSAHDNSFFDLIYGSGLADFFVNPFYPHQTPRRSRRPQQPLKLVEVELPLVSLQRCRRYFNNLREGVHVCAGAKGKDTCRGDSGGGLFCQNPADNRWYLYGVTSFGSGRGCGKYYGVYTCTSGISDWIHRMLS
ncbi:hypothetical protein AAHC03_021052 [Spirometra sp. Aus1]